MQRAAARGLADAALNAGLALLYVGTAKLGFEFAVVAKQVTLVWPPSGIALAAVVLLGRRMTPGILLGAFLANVTSAVPLAAAGSIAIGNTLEALAAGALLERVRCRHDLSRLRDSLALIGLAAASSPTISATIGALSLLASHLQPPEAFAELWRDWWLGDAVGVLTVAPVLLAWFGGRRAPFTFRAAFEACALSAAVFFLGTLVFARHGPSTSAYPNHYLAFPLVAWGAVRFGSRGSSLVVLATAAMAVASTTRGLGPFGSGRSDLALLLLQLFIAVLAITGLLLGPAITERNAVHEALRVEEAQRNLALSAARIGSWNWNIRTSEVQWSENLEAIHGLPRGTFGGTLAAFEDLVHPEDRQRVAEAIRTALEGGAEYEAEFRTLSAGAERWILGKGRVLKDDFGGPARMIGVAMDVTERHGLEEELRERARQLTEQDRRKDEFLAILAHELRNPLAPVVGAVELLRSKAGDKGAVERLRTILHRQITHLVRLVDDLLDVSRITSGKVQLQKQALDLRASVESALEMSATTIQERGVELVTSLPAEPVVVDADPVRMTQVVSNLVSNAVRHGGDRGHVWLSLTASNDDAELRIKDDGPGMSAEVLQRAFDLFAQGPGTGRTAGLGIGLTLVRELVKLHGGSVLAESAGPGRGSEFAVRIPLHGALESSITQDTYKKVSDSATGPLRSILVVDDNVDAAEMLVALVELRGHRASAAHDGAEALERARSATPDVMLLDLEMPVMNGYEVARAVRDDPALRDVVLIALSGYGQANDRDRTRAAGFDAHMVKPVQADTLFATLEAAHPRR